MIDVFDNQPIKENIPEIDLSPLTTPEEDKAIQEFYEKNPQLKQMLPSASNDAWVQTYFGQKVYPLNPDINTITIEDIAQSLSNQCRFTGHVRNFYSVAQHCVLVSYLCDKKDQLHGLLHDGSEYLITDLPSPLKKTPEFSMYKEIEKRIQNAIYRKFGLEEAEPPGVKEADLRLLATEARDLRPIQHPDWKLMYPPLPFKIVPLLPGEARQLFLDRFNELYKGA